MKVVTPDELGEGLWGAATMEEIPAVREILSEVRDRGDEAIREYTLRFDGVRSSDFRVEAEDTERAYGQLSPQAVSAMEQAAEHIQRFAEKQKEQLTDFEYNMQPGVFVGQRVVAIDRVGVYAPGGRFPLPTSVLMCAVPARVAGVREIVLCSPPSCGGTIHPTILAAARIAGVGEVYSIGGAQAIAALAYGSETVLPVDKIVGPGNRFVAEAKRQVFGTVGIDFVAGPSEILILADESACPRLVAADLLAQAEHDSDAVCVLVTTSAELAKSVGEEVERQTAELGRTVMAGASLCGDLITVVAQSMDEAIDLVNKRSPEHLELQLADVGDRVDRLTNYGSLFVGPYSAVALGDYSGGLNHTLPTNRSARYTGGLSVMDFLKVQTTLRVERTGIESIGPTAQHLAELEGLAAHARSVEIRLNSRQGGGHE